MAAAADSQVIRITMFKMARPEDRQKVLGFYEELKAEQKKDGKPYILSLEAGPVTNDDERTQGYTFISKTVFKNMEDHMFYDGECEAHNALKVKVKSALKVDGVLTVFYEPGASGIVARL